MLLKSQFSNQYPKNVFYSKEWKLKKIWAWATVSCYL